MRKSPSCQWHSVVHYKKSVIFPSFFFLHQTATGNAQQGELVADTGGDRWQEVYDDDGQPEGVQEVKNGTEQLGGADCPQDWSRNFPTVAPVCRGNDGPSFDIYIYIYIVLLFLLLDSGRNQ